MTNKIVTIGCDPEFFVRRLPVEALKLAVLDPLNTAKNYKEYSSLRAAQITQEIREEDDDIVPICGLLGGTKDAPKALSAKKPGFMYQEDGAAGEFNIPPATTPTEFSHHIAFMLNELGPLLKSKGLRFAKTNNLTLKPKWTTDHPNLLTIGCDPDYCAYSVKDGVAFPRIPSPDKVGLIRGAGGHVHIGYDIDLCPQDILVRLLDISVGLPSLSLDKQGLRRQWWGQAGTYRPKPYGLEYRTLSNFWIWSGGQSKLVSATVFALLDSLRVKMIPWQALYNAVDWSKVQGIFAKENTKGAAAYFKQLVENFPVFKNMYAEAQNRALNS